MGTHEWPLILFTVIAQTAMGAFWWCFAAQIFGKIEADKKNRLEKLMIVIWLLVGLGFACAAFHLGSPLRFINASFRFGYSAFSNEVVFGSAFAAAGFITWFLAWRDMASKSTRNWMYWLTFILSLGFIYGMVSFYLMPTVPTWNTPLTPIAYLVTAALGGSAVAAILFVKAGINQGIFATAPLKLATTAVVVALVATIAQSNSLAAINSSIQHASTLSPHYVQWMALRFVLLIAALYIWIRGAKVNAKISLPAGIFCIILLMLGEMIGRGVFYGLHMTVGLR